MAGKARGGGGGRKNTVNPNTAVLKTPGKQATPVKGGTGVVINAARAATGPARKNPSGVPSVTPLKGQGAVSRTKNSGADSTRNK